MECKRCMPTSAPQTPGWCSFTTAYSKHWKQQGFAKSPRSMPMRRTRTRWGGSRLCWEASGQEAECQVLLNGTRTAHAVQLSLGHSCHQLWGHHHQAVVPCACVSWVHASCSIQAAMRQAVVAPAPALAEGFEEQTVEESNQRWAAISTWEQTARECLEHKRTLCSSDHDAPDLKGEPVNIVFFQAAFQWDIQSCCKHWENWGMRCLAVLGHVPAHDRSETLVPDTAQYLVARSPQPQHN